jgi:putative aminopeptidase FrvX
MDSYDMIGSIRLTERKGPKPNANAHIVIILDHEDNVGFFIKEVKDALGT